MRKLVAIREVKEFPIYDITVENDHCFELENGIIAHNSMYPKTVVGGGTGITYASDAVWVLGRQQEKDGTEVMGYNFIINIEKSRHVKEKSKIPVSVSFNGWINKNSGLIDLALESGNVIKPKNGWYAIVNMETGEISEKSYRLKELESNKDFFEKLLKDKHFNEFVEKRFKLGAAQHSHSYIQNEEIIEEEER